MKRTFAIILLVCISIAFTSCYRTEWSCTCYTKVNDSLTNHQYWDMGKITASKAGDMCRAHRVTTADTCYVMGYK